MQQRPVDAFLEVYSCALPDCGKEFKPKRRAQRFCCPEHKAKYHKTIYQMGRKAIEVLEQGENG